MKHQGQTTLKQHVASTMIARMVHLLYTTEVPVYLNNEDLKKDVSLISMTDSMVLINLTLIIQSTEQLGRVTFLFLQSTEHLGRVTFLFL